MSAELLLKHLADIADLPDDIPALRRFILDMAVRGKLVPQNPKDEPAVVLLERIKAERQKQERAGKVKPAKPLPSLTDEEKPFAIPAGWEWARLGEVLIYDAGINFTPGQLKGEKWLLELEDIEKNTSRLLQKIKVKERPAKSHKSEFMKGDVLYGKLRPYLNKALVASEEGYSTTEIVSLRPYCDIVPEYVVVCLKRSDFHAYVEQSGQGTKMPRLRKVDAIKASFPLPPLAEQKRIVAKVNELMTLCDKLETAMERREESGRRFVLSSLEGLKSPPQSLAKSARSALSSFADITARPEYIKELRNAILDMAVRGKLAPQNPKDEPAAVLLERIKAERQKQERAGKVKPAKPLPSLTDEEKPFMLPCGWVWCRLGDIGIINPRNDATDDTGAGFAPMSLIDSKFGELPNYQLKKWGEIKRGFTHFANGDVVVAKITPCFENSKAGIIRNLPNDIGAGTTELHVLRPFIKNELSDYIYIEIKTDRFLVNGKEQMHGGAGQKRVPKEYFANFLISLPPLAEQKRIVAKVNELMTLCDKLETALRQQEESRQKTLNTLLGKALAENAPA